MQLYFLHHNYVKLHSEDYIIRLFHNTSVLDLNSDFQPLMYPLRRYDVFSAENRLTTVRRIQFNTIKNDCNSCIETAECSAAKRVHTLQSGPD